MTACARYAQDGSETISRTSGFYPPIALVEAERDQVPERPGETLTPLRGGSIHASFMNPERPTSKRSVEFRRLGNAELDRVCPPINQRGVEKEELGLVLNHTRGKESVGSRHNDDAELLSVLGEEDLDLGKASPDLIRKLNPGLVVLGAHSLILPRLAGGGS